MSFRDLVIHINFLCFWFCFFFCSVALRCNKGKTHDWPHNGIKLDLTRKEETNPHKPPKVSSLSNCGMFNSAKGQIHTEQHLTPPPQQNGGGGIIWKNCGSRQRQGDHIPVTIKAKETTQEKII